MEGKAWGLWYDLEEISACPCIIAALSPKGVKRTGLGDYEKSLS